MIKKYKKKPIVIDALQFDGNNYKECKNFIKGNFDNTLNYPNIKTLEGTMRVENGAYIIKGVQGEFYACKEDIFLDTYEEVISNKDEEELPACLPDDIAKQLEKDGKL